MPAPVATEAQCSGPEQNLSRNPTEQLGASANPVSKRHNEKPSQKCCLATTLAIAKVELQTIPNQDPVDGHLKNQQNMLHKRDYYNFLKESICKYNMDNNADLHIENTTMNVMMSVLFRSQIPIQRLRSLQPVIFGPEQSGKEGSLLAFRLPIKVLQQDLSKISPETLQGDEVLTWGLCGSHAAQIGDCIMGGLTKAGPQCYDGKWCWAFGSLHEQGPTETLASGQMLLLLEKFKRHVCNMANVAVEVTHCGMLVKGQPPPEPGPPRVIFHSRTSAGRQHAFLPTDAVVTGLLFYNTTSGELPGWPADLRFDEFCHDER